MPKKIKLDLNDLRLKSFVTSVDKQDKIRGGIETPACTEDPQGCKTGTCTLGPCCFTSDYC